MLHLALMAFAVGPIALQKVAPSSEGLVDSQGLRVPRASDVAPSIDLQLPRIAPVSKLGIASDLRMMDDGLFWRSYFVKLPQTGWTVASETSSPDKVSESVEFQLPEGSYVVNGWTSFPGCGNGAPWPYTATNLDRTVQCDGGREVELTHTMRSGASLPIRVEFEGAPSSAKRFLDPAPGERRDTYWTGPEHNPLDQWYATATILRLDNETKFASPSVSNPPRTMVWGWNTIAYAIGRKRIPLNTDVYTINVYAPGRYRVRLEGPLIEPKTVEITVLPEEVIEEAVLRTSPRSRMISVRARN